MSPGTERALLRIAELLPKLARELANAVDELRKIRELAEEEMDTRSCEHCSHARGDHDEYGCSHAECKGKNCTKDLYESSFEETKHEAR